MPEQLEALESLRKLRNYLSEQGITDKVQKVLINEINRLEELTYLPMMEV